MAVTYFSLVFGPFDPAEAVGTLPGQLELLRTFRDVGPEGAALVYRLQTEKEADGDLTATFRMLCVGRSQHTLNDAERGSILDQAAVLFVPAWSLTEVHRDPALIHATHRVRLVPRPDPHHAGLQIKPDWAPIVDVLRRRSAAIAIDLVCTPLDTPLTAGSFASLVGPHHHIDMGSKEEWRASEFFCATAADISPASRALGLHLMVHSDEPMDQIFLSQVGRLIFGQATTAQAVTRDLLFPRNVDAVGFVGHPEQVIRAFHPPYGHIEGRGLRGYRDTTIPIRFRISEPKGAQLGTAIRQGLRVDSVAPVNLSDEDRLRHVYIVGKTGSGKTNLLKHLVRQDIKNGHGVAVLDPHGQLVAHALDHVGDRSSDVVLLDFSDPTHVPVINPLMIDIKSNTDEEMATEELIDVLIRRSFNQFTGPVFEDTVRMAASSLYSDEFREFGPPSLPLTIEILRHEKLRRWAASKLTQDDTLRSQWVTFEAMQGFQRAEQIRWVLAKFTEFAPGGNLHEVTGVNSSKLSFEDVFKERKILLVKMPESAMGKRAAAIVGSLVFARIHRAAKQSNTSSETPFHLHADEFQRFVDVEIEELVAEARKFNLALTFAHQNLRQLDAFSRYEGTASSRLREAIFSNVGTMVAMRTSGSDVQELARELGVSERDVRHLRQYTGLARPVVGGIERETFVLTNPNADEHKGDPRAATAIRQRMIDEGFWIARASATEAIKRQIAKVHSASKPKAPEPLKSPEHHPNLLESDFASGWQRRKELGRDDQRDVAKTKEDASVPGSAGGAKSPKRSAK